MFGVWRRAFFAKNLFEYPMTYERHPKDPKPQAASCPCVPCSLPVSKSAMKWHFSTDFQSAPISWKGTPDTRIRTRLSPHQS